MNPNFQIGPVSFYFYGLILGLATFLSVLVAKFQARIAGFSQQVIDEVILILIIPTILGARVYHVLDYWNYYSKNWTQIFYLWQGGIGIIGAILAGLVTLFIYSKFCKFNFLKLADIAAPAVAIGQSVGRLGNFVNSEGFGPPTNLPWGVYIETSTRPEIFAKFEKFHPTFFYESLGDFLIFMILVLTPTKKAGSKFALYLILYSALRFGLEFLRIDTWQVGIIKVAQVIAAAGFVAGFMVLFCVTKLKWTFKFST